MRTRQQAAAPLTSRAVMTSDQVVQHSRRDGGLVPNAGCSAAVRYAAERLADPLCQPAGGGPRRGARVRACARERRAPEQPSGDGASRTRPTTSSLTASAAQRPAESGGAPDRDSGRDHSHATTGRRSGNRGARRAASEGAELQSELDLVNARRNLLNNMVDFAHETDANGSGVSALKEHINAIAASIPAANAGAMPELAAAEAQAGAAGVGNAAPSPTIEQVGARRFGLWDLGSNVLQAPEQALDDRRGRPPHGSASADIHPDSRDARAADQDTFRSRRRARRAARRERRGRAQDCARRVRHDRVALCSKRPRFSCP